MRGPRGRRSMSTGSAPRPSELRVPRGSHTGVRESSAAMRNHDAVFGVQVTMGVILLAAGGSRVLGGSLDGDPSRSGADLPPVAVILDQPDFPRLGAPSDPRRIATILRNAGWHCRLFSASELAD